MSNSPKYQIKIYYPQITAPSTNAQRNFNHIAKEWAVKKVHDFKNTVQNWDTSKLSPEIKAKGSSMAVKYELYTVDPNKLISLRYSTDSFLVGAAHGSHVYNSINYDLTRDKQLSLNDVFKENSNYLNKIAEISANKVKEKLAQEANGHVDIFKEGLLPIRKNYDVWNFTPQGLKLTFNEYQVAAYVFGAQEIIIPYKVLGPYFATNTLLADCLIHSNCQITERKQSRPH